MNVNLAGVSLSNALSISLPRRYTHIELMDFMILLSHKPDSGPDEVGSGKRWVLCC